MSKKTMPAIVIYGRWSPDWNDAFKDPTTWEGMDCYVRQVDRGSTLSPDVIAIPLMEPDICSLMEKPNIRCLIPSRTIVETWQDKILFDQFVQQHSLSRYTPLTYTATNAIYPCICKPSRGCNGQSIRILQQAEPCKVNYILQKFIPGTVEYVSHCLCKEGRLLELVTYEYALPSGTSINSSRISRRLRTIQTTPAQLECINAFIKAGNFSGPCNFDYKLDGKGQPLIFEINPRFGGSLMRPENRKDLRSFLQRILTEVRL